MENRKSFHIRTDDISKVKNIQNQIYSASQNLILFCRKDQATRTCPGFGTGSYGFRNRFALLRKPNLKNFRLRKKPARRKINFFRKRKEIDFQSKRNADDFQNENRNHVIRISHSDFRKL
ncbi:hypothetical protein EHQ97_13780 [Leptospira adleri]|nr:hypothetical protein EHQ97_13780 [Leptospira adleri]